MNLYPNSQTNLYGLQDNLLVFAKLFDQKRLPSKILLTGQKGIGKCTLAYHLINFVLSKDEEMPYDLAEFKINLDNRSFKLIQNGSCPNFNLIDINPDKKNIDIEQIRELIIQLNKSSFNNKPRFVLIDNIEYLNLNSVNALLKTLEEPNENIFFILINSNKKIIPTLLSRCINFNISLENDKVNEISSLLFDNDIDNLLNKDLLNYYSTPGEIYNLLKFSEEKKINLKDINLKDFLLKLISENIYKDDKQSKTFVYNILELFLIKDISVSNSDVYNYFLKRINDFKKFNLDDESLFLEINSKLLNGIADFFARFKRIDGFKVYFLTGTDEHGLKIQRAAEKKGVEPLAFCDEISKTFKNLSKTLNLTNNDFIRTTESRHKKSVQYLWEELKKNDDIYLSKYSGWYSVSDEAFYNEDEIEDLDNKKVAISSKSPVEWVDEESYFFRLSKWEKALLEFYEKNPDFISPASRKNEVISFVKNGLKDLSVSRKSFSWGIKVPNDDDHVIYVWLDALTNYISALNYPNKDDELYKKFWPASVHLIGKDILRFHAIYWPAFLLAAKITPPKKVYGHGWILSNEEKMSKSKGNILDPLEIIKQYGLDPLRYYLIKEVSFGNDGNISQERLEDCINSDLANNFGNLCQRVSAFVIKNCDSKVPEKIKFENDDIKILDEYSQNLDKLRSEIDNQNINYYIDYIVNRLFEANKYFNDQEPWKKKDDKIRLNTIVYTTLEIVRKVTFLLYPIIPQSSLKALKIFNLEEKDVIFQSIGNNEFLKKGSAINKIDILFNKIEKEND